MADYTGDNLRRVMAQLGLTIGQVVEKTGLDKRTVKGILDGSNKPQPRTIHRLAAGLGVSANEFFLDPAQLLYRRFDVQTNPVVQEVVEAHPEQFSGWTAADFDELHSRFGTGGPMTAEGTLFAVESMNRKRVLHEKLAVLLETDHVELISGIVDLLYDKVVVSPSPDSPWKS